MRAVMIATGLALTLAACGTSTGRVTAVSAATRARWTPASHIPRVLDLSAPRYHASCLTASCGVRLTLRYDFEHLMTAMGLVS